jgi:para-aminobenzoate synthetase component 1
MTLAGAQNRINELGSRGIPFFMMADFELRRPQVWQPHEWKAAGVQFSFAPGDAEHAMPVSVPSAFPPGWAATPPSFSSYLVKFGRVYAALQRGDAYVVNLTDRTELHSVPGLEQLFRQSRARYKVWMPGQWLCFSPEQFVFIRDGVISTFPMKGTAPAGSPDALQRLLEDEKEKAEHVTVVDLLRNDLARVADGVEVARFRFPTLVHTHRHALWQVSSEIRGRLGHGYQRRLGDIIFSMLPAGSVSGAPKKKTLEIIRQTEGEPRGFYTGVAGYFDGTTFDSCVLIRFIEQTGNRYFFRSGGGITTASEAAAEYRELIDKVYVPVA